MRQLLFIILIFLNASCFGEEVFSIGISWLGRSPMSEEITTGAMETFRDLVPDLKVEIRGNLKNENELRILLETYAKTKDAVVLLRSSGARFLINNPQSIPSFIGAANDPVMLGITTNTDRPGGNITGVSYQIDMNEIIQLMSNLLPEINALLYLYEEGHPGSPVDSFHLSRACKNASIDFIEAGCSSTEDVLREIESRNDDVDAIVLGNQAFFHNIDFDDMSYTGEVPFFSLNSLLVSKGVLASISADDRKLGRLLAGSIISVLYGNKKVGDIPIQFDRDPVISINITTAEKLGLIIPIHMLRVAEVYR